MASLQALPTQHLPEKSHETKSAERRTLIRCEPAAAVPVNTPPYHSFVEFVKKLAPVKLNGWTREVTAEMVKLTHTTENAIIPKYTVIVEKSLNYQCFVFGWRVPKEHNLFASHSLNDLTISVLLNKILSFELCPGV